MAQEGDFIMKPKKHTGNQQTNLDPVNTTKKKKTGQGASGSPESEGGSRQGNIGHEQSGQEHKGSRQV